MTRVLVLSGGGSRGAWQAGWLRAQSGEYAAIYGVSVGAINAVRVAQHRLVSDAARALEFDWLNTSTANVLASWPVGVASAAVEGSLYSTTPLAAMLRRRLVERVLVHPVSVFATSLATGGLARFAITGSPERDVRALLASAAFPGAMPSVEIDGDRFYDGGLQRVVPLVEALLDHYQADEIDVAICDDPSSSLDAIHPRGGLRGLLRAVDVATHDRARTDLLAARAEWDSLPMRPRVRLWWPTKQHISDVMDFSPTLTERALRQGYEDGQRGPCEVWQ